MKKSVLKDKSFRFAVRIVNLYKYLCEEKKEFVMSKQVLKCGTSKIYSYNNVTPSGFTIHYSLFTIH